MTEAVARAQRGLVAKPENPLKQLDDSGVVAAFLAGERRAFNELVERYQNRLLNFVYRR